MGIVRMGPPKELILKIKDESLSTDFVETGTFNGGTCFWAKHHFPNVYTIEINEEISKQTASRPDCPEGIQFLIGNSRDVLPQISGKLKPNAIFWLDGHYSGPGTGGEEHECPIMEELESIMKCDNPIIFIDDARCFLGPPLPPHKQEQWPTVDEIFQFFHLHFPDHYNTIHDDVIISINKKYKYLLDQDWLTNYEDRFFPKPPEKKSFYRKLKDLFN